MTIEPGSLKDWDDRDYQSIDDLPPEAWDAVRDKRLRDIEEAAKAIQSGLMSDLTALEIGQMIIASGFKRD